MLLVPRGPLGSSKNSSCGAKYSRRLDSLFSFLNTDLFFYIFDAIVWNTPRILSVGPQIAVAAETPSYLALQMLTVSGSWCGKLYKFSLISFVPIKI